MTPIDTRLGMLHAEGLVDSNKPVANIEVPALGESKEFMEAMATGYIRAVKIANALGLAGVEVSSMNFEKGEDPWTYLVNIFGFNLASLELKKQSFPTTEG